MPEAVHNLELFMFEIQTYREFSSMACSLSKLCLTLR